VFTILESFGSVYLFRRIENDLHCGDNSVLDRLQGFLNLFHTNALVKNLVVVLVAALFLIYQFIQTLSQLYVAEGKRDGWQRS